MAAAPVEIVNLRVVGKGLVEKLEMMKPAPGDREPAAAPSGHREAFFDGAFKKVPVYDGLRLPPGIDLMGPLIVEQETTTVIVQPGYRLTCDDYGNYLVYREGATLEESISALKKGA
jgi:N-methylhydantoinase A